MRQISWLAEQVLASREGFRSMELVALWVATDVSEEPSFLILSVV
jgi:hypothetical protein